MSGLTVNLTTPLLQRLPGAAFIEVSRRGCGGRTRHSCSAFPALPSLRLADARLDYARRGRCSAFPALPSLRSAGRDQNPHGKELQRLPGAAFIEVASERQRHTGGTCCSAFPALPSLRCVEELAELKRLAELQRLPGAAFIEVSQST